MQWKSFDPLTNLTSINAVSESSVKNVLWPAMIWSLAPIPTKIRSTELKTVCMDICSYLKEPLRWKPQNNKTQSCTTKTTKHYLAQITAKQTWQRSWFPPPMLGLVRRMKLAWPEPPIIISLGTKVPLPKESLLRIGCPRIFAEKHGTSSGLDKSNIIGLLVCPS